MFDSISFCIGDKTIEVNGQQFDLGRITVDILNIEESIYADLRHLLEQAIHRQEQYEKPISCLIGLKQTNYISSWIPGCGSFHCIMF